MANPVLWIYVGEHCTAYEGSTTKVHVANDEGKLLCGSLLSTGGGASLVTMEFLTQADPDNTRCKRCTKSALKILKH